MKRPGSLSELSDTKRSIAWKRKLFFRNLVLMLLVFLLPSGLASGIAAFSYRYSVEKNASIHGEVLAENTAQQLETYFDRHVSFLRGLNLNTNVRWFMLFPDEDPVLRYDYSRIAETITSYKTTDDIIMDIMLYSEASGTSIAWEGRYRKNPYFDNGWIANADTLHKKDASWVEVRPATSHTLTAYLSMTLYCRYFFNNISIGVSAVSLDLAKLSSALALNLTANDRAIWLSTGDGTIYPLCGDPNDTDSCRLYSRELSYGDFTVNVAEDTSDHSGGDAVLLRWLIILLIICLAAAILITLLVYRSVVKPYNTVTEMLSSPDTEAEGDAHHVDYVITGLRNLMDENRRNVSELQQRGENLKRMQTLALQAQINPHMLYNTLDSINWTVMERCGVENDASTMLTLLASVLRYATDDSSLTVSFFTELEHMEQYIALQRLRYENSFTLDLQYDESVSEYRILRMVLQPILENAIEHGIKNKQKDGVLAIRIREKENDIEVQITDNGSGMDENQLAVLRAEMKEPSERRNGRGVGLYNVSRRMELFYGSDYVLSVESVKERGTTVSFSVPKQK